jgi:hypothetical protein
MWSPRRRQCRDRKARQQAAEQPERGALARPVGRADQPQQKSPAHQPGTEHLESERGRALPGHKQPCAEQQRKDRTRFPPALEGGFGRASIRSMLIDIATKSRPASAAAAPTMPTPNSNHASGSYPFNRPSSTRRDHAADPRASQPQWLWSLVLKIAKRPSDSRCRGFSAHNHK